MNTAAKSLLATTGLTLALACGGSGGGSGLPYTAATPTSLQVSVHGTGLAWAAIQDGTGAWSTLSLASGSATVPVHDASGRYGLALGYVDPNNNHKVTQIWQGTLAEKSQIDFWIPGGQPVDLNGSVSGLGASDIAFGLFGKAFRGTGTNTSFSTNCAPGTSDLVVIGWDPSTGQVDKALIQRSKTFNASATVPPIDMTSAPGLVPTTVSIPGLTGTAYLGGEIITNGGTHAGLSNPSFASAPYSIQTLGASSLSIGDLQNVFGEESVPGAFRFASTYFTSASSLGLNLPAGFSGNITSVSGSFIAQWNSVPNALVYAGSARQSSSLVYSYFWITKGWLGSGSTLLYMTPDLQAISGWSYTAGQSVSWSLGGEGATYSIQSPAYKAGDSDWGTFANGSFVPMQGGSGAPMAGPRETERPEERRELRTRLTGR